MYSRVFQITKTFLRQKSVPMHAHFYKSERFLLHQSDHWSVTAIGETFSSIFLVAYNVYALT